MHLVTLVNAISHVVVLIRCTLAVSMLVDAVIEVMLMNASHVAVRDCCHIYCTLEVAWVNTVSCIAVLICCTLVVSTLASAVL